MIGLRISRHCHRSVFADIGPQKPRRERRAAVIATMRAIPHGDVSTRFAIALASATQAMLAAPNAIDDASR
jgi:hypothetical protein